MKKLIYAVAFTLAFTSSVDTVFASGKPGDFSTSHLIKSAVIPNFINFCQPIYRGIPVANYFYITSLQ